MVNMLAEELALELRSVSPFETGAMSDALGYVSQPEKTGKGWKVGVGNRKYLGDKETPSPKGTIWAFLKDYPQFFKFPREINGRKNYSKATAWRDLPEAGKRMLDGQRQAGKYGGIGANYARYIWAQNDGNAGAGITAQNFLETAIKSWKAKVPELVRMYLAQTP